jgi:hypothetical protein
MFALAGRLLSIESDGMLAVLRGIKNPQEIKITKSIGTAF